MRIRELLKKAQNTLENAGVPDPENDAMALLLHIKGWNLQDYILASAGESGLLSEEDEKEFLELIGRRAKRIPLQHLTGYADFYGYRFRVNEHVLIPRYDTEILVHTVLQENPVAAEHNNCHVLDLCTGSGCIAVTLKKEGGYQTVDASDIDPETVRTAAENAEKLEASVNFYTGDLFSALPAAETEEQLYDLIVSNPPYIAETERKDLEPEVVDHDPEKALFAGQDGLLFYRRIIAEAPAHLKKAGKLYLEIGYLQKGPVSQLLLEHGFRDIRVVQDLSGKDRVIRGIRGDHV